MKYRERRKATDFQVILLDEDAGPVRVTVRDASLHGVRIAGVADAEPGVRAALEVRGRAYAGVLQWAEGGEAGLRFDRPLPPDAFDLITRSAARTHRKHRFVM